MTSSLRPATPKAKPRVVLRVRVVKDSEVLLGPGKVELMKHIADCGSISEAAKRMEMSYNRAWLHVKTLNSAFKEPLVLSLRGGTAGGGATLSDTAKSVIALYDKMVKAADKAAQQTGSTLRALLK
jgi:molybdate transport system regulatory protein